MLSNHQKDQLKQRFNSNQLQHRHHLGQCGEALALAYLEAEGYRLESKNWCGQRGELDLIMMKDNVLVIIEVRTTSGSWLERPAEATPLSKQKQVARCADEYINQRTHLLFKQGIQAQEPLNIRFDVIGLSVPKNNMDSLKQISLDQLKEYGITIDHVEDAYHSPWAF